MLKYKYEFRIINRKEEFAPPEVVNKKEITLNDGTKIYTATLKRKKPIPPAKYSPGFVRIQYYKLFKDYLLEVKKTPKR